MEPLDLRNHRRHFLRKASCNWEEIFFPVSYLLLALQEQFFRIDVSALADRHWAISWFASYDSFAVSRLLYFAIPAFLLPLVFIFSVAKTSLWRRRYKDALGIYLTCRMLDQVTMLNILIFDSITPRILLISQLLLFLPYSLLVWGWIYWRLDSSSQGLSRPFFCVDYSEKAPRPIDYFVASFSSMLSASASSIKGNYARSRVIIFLHGLMIYDLMALILSRAVSLAQGR